MFERGREIPLSRVVVVITMQNTSPWKEIFEQGQIPTWVKQFQNLGVQVLTIESNHPHPALVAVGRFIERWRYGSYLGRFVRSFLWVAHRLLPPSKIVWQVVPGAIPKILEESPSSYLSVFRRNGALFEWFLSATSYDFLYRVHSSSFVDPVGLNLFLESLDSNVPIVAGKSGVNSQGHEFLSGAGILFTRSAVQVLNNRFRHVRRDLPEDVGLGLLCTSEGLERTAIERVDYESLQQLTENPIPEGVFHFRCKSPQRPGGDIEIMKALGRHFF